MRSLEDKDEKLSELQYFNGVCWRCYSEADNISPIFTVENGLEYNFPIAHFEKAKKERIVDGKVMLPEELIKGYSGDVTLKDWVLRDLITFLLLTVELDSSGRYSTTTNTETQEISICVSSNKVLANLLGIMSEYDITPSKNIIPGYARDFITIDNKIVSFSINKDVIPLSWWSLPVEYYREALYAVKFDNRRKLLVNSSKSNVLSFLRYMFSLCTGCSCYTENGYLKECVLEPTFVKDITISEITGVDLEKTTSYVVMQSSTDCATYFIELNRFLN